MPESAEFTVAIGGTADIDAEKQTRSTNLRQNTNTLKHSLRFSGGDTPTPDPPKWAPYRNGGTPPLRYASDGAEPIRPTSYEMVTFILVHGTFAKRASWTLPGSILRIYLERVMKGANQKSDFQAVSWSGRNFGHDRMQAARSIAEVINSSKNRDANEKIFLIGHSHGGSAIAYFLKAFPELREDVTGAAFLSTPFVATRVRSNWALFLRALLFSLGLILFSIAFVGVGVAFAYIYAGYLWMHVPPGSEFLFFPISALLAVIIAYFVWRRTEESLKRYVEEHLPKKLRQLETADIFPGNYLFVRATGDEAAGVLSVAQTISWVMGIIGAIASTIVAYAEIAWKWSTRGIWGRIVCLLFATLFGYWITQRATISIFDRIFCLMFSHDCGRFDFVKLWVIPARDKLGYPELEFFLEPLQFAVFVLWPIFLAILLSALVYSVLLLLTACVSAFSLMLFGWIGFLEALFAEFAVEPVPYGPVMLFHVDWEGQTSPSIFGLNHSNTYANIDALKHLAEWILATRAR